MPNEDAVTERDPRTDPKPGDVLQKKYQGQYFESRGYMERQVDEIYSRADDKLVVVYVGPNVCVPEVLLSSWRKWAKTAEVIHRAE